MEKIYFIQKEGYVGNSLLWWAKDGKGYTTNIENAEEFGEEESIKIVSSANSNKKRHLKEDVILCSEKHVNSESENWNKYIELLSEIEKSIVSTTEESKKILILDIETTGFLQQGGKIVEVGIVELDLNNGARKILFDRVCHEKGITMEEVENSWIVKNSDLTVEAVRNSESLEKLKPEIQGILDSYPSGATAFNNSFDFGYLEHRGFRFPKKLPCPMLLSTNICKLPSPRGGYKWPKVQEAFEFFFGKTEYIEKHRGADDAFHEAMIVHKLYELNVFKLN